MPASAWPKTALESFAHLPSNDARRQHFVSHAAYLNNIVSPSRCDRTKTIFQVLFNRRADVRRIPPIGAFCAVYTDRRQLQDQSFGVTSKQGVFIGIARYKKVLGYVVTDGKSLFVTRDHITFDPQLFPFKLKPTTSPDWQTFYNLTNPVAEGAVTPAPTSSAPADPMPDYASDESDLDPDFDSSKDPESADINDTPTIPLLTNHLLRCAHRQRLRCHPDPGGVSSLHD